MSWLRGKWADICLCLGIYDWTLTPPQTPLIVMPTHSLSRRFLHGAQYAIHWIHQQWMKAYPDVCCHGGYSAPKWTYRWEIVHLFSDVFSHLFQPEPFSASHTTLGWDVLFRSFPSTPLQAYFTMLWLFLNILLKKRKKGHISSLFLPRHFKILMKQGCVTAFFSVLKAEQSCADSVSLP